MLNLTLKEGETLHIGDEISIVFHRHQDPLMQRCGLPALTRQVKAAIDAPKHVLVLREEKLPGKENTLHRSFSKRERT
jgi:sRNA-binding carbon storage regulator CsrA